MTSIRIPANWRLITTEVENAVTLSLLKMKGNGMEFILVAPDHSIVSLNSFGKRTRFSFAQASAAECHARRLNRSVRRTLIATREGVFDVTVNF